jgi:prepilin-type N-terminal cleavage/methylation domain-containing protein
MSRKNGFTLIEIMVSLVVFAMVMATMGSVFYKTLKDWQRQRDYNLVLENGRWAMEFMSNKIKASSSDVNVTDAAESPLNDHELLAFMVDPNGNGNAKDKKVYFWRGQTGSTDEHMLYYGQVNWNRDLADAMDVRKELSRFVVSGTDIFNVYECATGNCTVELNLTVRPKPDQSVGPGNQNYTFRTIVRPRN